MQRFDDLTPETLGANIIHDDIFVDKIAMMRLYRLTVGVTWKQIDPLMVCVCHRTTDGCTADIEGVDAAGIVETKKIMFLERRFIADKKNMCYQRL